MNPERRRFPRVSFIAHAKVTDAASETTVNARISELSINGCYMDMINPLPFDTLVQIEITHADKTFRSAGKVIYSQPHMGMGVVFTSVTPENQAIVKEWTSTPAH
jgi:PilZ domain-containing protein